MKIRKEILLDMQIFEVKNDTAEILYACNEENLYLFDFLFIEDEELTIVSQVTDISSTENEDINIATVKFCLSVDKNNRLTKYNGHTPPKNAEVGYLDAGEIIGLFKPKVNAINWGKYARNLDLLVSTDFKFLSSGFCTICDKSEQAEAIVRTLVSSLEKTNTRTVVLDFDGKYQNIKTTNKAVFGKEYRIPLDGRALDYIFENDLEDCSPDAKVVIQNIILEIQKYIESVDKGFISFETFLQIIMSETKRTANKGLMAFCNKLLNYKYKKIFADRESQFSIIDNCDGSFKLDLSAVDEKFYPLVFGSVVSRLYKKFYVIADITDENTQTATMRGIYEKQNVRLLPVISHESKYLSKVKAHCNNFAVFAPIEKVKSTEFYSEFIDKLKNDEFVLYGENSLFVPLLVSVEKQTNKNDIQNEDAITDADLDDLDRANLELIKKMMREEELKKDAMTVSEDDLNDLESLYNPDSFVQQKQAEEQKLNQEKPEKDSTYILIKNVGPAEVSDYSPTKEEDEQFIKLEKQAEADIDNLKKEKITPASKQVTEPEQIAEELDIVEETEVVESQENVEVLDNSIDDEILEDDTIKEIETSDEDAENVDVVEEEPIEEIVDEEEIEEEPQEQQVIEEQPQVVESQSVVEEQQISEQKPQVAEKEPIAIEKEPQVKEKEVLQVANKPVQKEPPRIKVEQKPVEIKIAQPAPKPQKPLPKANELPVYEPKETSSPQSETNFSEGMRVSHAKYGVGTIEKIIKFGKKTLCSIQFDTLGRRLLDPNITTLERM